LLAAEEQGLAWHIDGVEEALPLLSLLDRWQREGNRFVMGIEEEQDGVTNNRFPTLVHIPDEIAGKPHPKAAGISGMPRVFRHVLARGVKPWDILDPLAINRTAQEKLAALKDRLGAPDLQHGAHKVAEGLLLIGQRPMEPRELIILAIRIIVAALRAPHLVTGQQHGDALGEDQCGQEVALLLRP
jgi:hypothetical protein